MPFISAAPVPLPINDRLLFFEDSEQEYQTMMNRG